MRKRKSRAHSNASEYFLKTETNEGFFCIPFAYACTIQSGNSRHQGKLSLKFSKWIAAAAVCMRRSIVSLRIRSHSCL